MGAPYRTDLELKTADNAEGDAARVLQETKQGLGFVPNMYGAMANAPGVLTTYQHGYAYLRQNSGFTPQQQEVVFLTISVANGCGYCRSAHGTIADNMSKVPKEVTDAILDGKPAPDETLAALQRFVQVMFDTRGKPEPSDVETFKAAGFSERHVMEVILALAVKTLSNYTNHIFHTPVDDAFAGRS
ncbi:carboxymuconolactone decarboxylase family protein [Aquisalimonas sp. 2447]|uniref:carboxymuconolactone decarboxylase family protein n=1 Tax=Aquisalimonas sp. 2447 TaxID=2740807 RepID=UPI00143235C7|nr:carboxymuconolactone decarboxylase family protein [Aquisalimonas sp. 2447]QIT56090.1 carboxymuconolactone decarboxylase family protein [Aquisalimonas sp. 2447]